MLSIHCDNYFDWDDIVNSFASEKERRMTLTNILNPIRPGGGGSEARMTKLTAANQKPLAQ